MQPELSHSVRSSLSLTMTHPRPATMLVDSCRSGMGGSVFGSFQLGIYQ